MSMEPLSHTMVSPFTLTSPPLEIASEPVPPGAFRLPPTLSVELVQVEPVPETVTTPLLPALRPMSASVLDTAPPCSIVSEPVPSWPTVNWSPLVQVEPAPVTVTAPTLPARMARKASPPLETAPPAAIVSVPEPKSPTNTEPVVVQVDPAPVTVTVPLLPVFAPTYAFRSETAP